jgi:hypothetical protein
VAVMDYLMAHIDGWAEFLERSLYDLDRPDDTGAKSPRLRQDNLHKPNRCESLCHDPMLELTCYRGMQSRRFFIISVSRNRTDELAVLLRGNR